MFTECHRKDEDRAQKLLTRVSEAWGKTTCLQLALEAKDMKFVSHGGVQVTAAGLRPGGAVRGAAGADAASRSHGGTHVPVLRGPLGTWGQGPVLVVCCGPTNPLHSLCMSGHWRRERVGGGPLPGSLQSSGRPQRLPLGKAGLALPTRSLLLSWQMMGRVPCCPPRRVAEGCARGHAGTLH